jgi:general transcription factor IIIA
MKLHEQRDIEEQMLISQSRSLTSPNEDAEPPLKRRRGGEIGRDWICDADGCDKEFKSVSLLLKPAME